MLAIKMLTPSRMSITRREALILSPFPNLPVICQSVVMDAAAHRLLSTVESRPERHIIMNGARTQAGSTDMMNSMLTILESAATKPVPAAAKPTMLMARGTRPNSKAPKKNDLPSLSLRIAKILCQKHWSPKGPEIRPTAVGRPNPRNTASPVSDTSEVWSPVSEPSPASTESTPPVFESSQGTMMAQPRKIMPSCTTSVAIDAFMPEKRE